MKNETKILWNKIPFREQTFPEIPTDIGDLDLHGFATLRNINFNVKKNIFSIRFVESEVGKLNIGKTVISRCEIVFKKPMKIIFGERDPEMPRWCDEITESIVLFEVDKYREVEFFFHGGRTLLVSAEDAVVLYEE